MFSAPFPQDAAALSLWVELIMNVGVFLLFIFSSLHTIILISPQWYHRTNDSWWKVVSADACVKQFFLILHFSLLGFFFFSFRLISLCLLCCFCHELKTSGWSPSLVCVFSSRPPTVAHRSCFHHNTLDTSVFCLPCEGFCQAVRLKANTKSSVHFSSGSSSPWSNFSILKTAYSQDMALKATELRFCALLKVFNWKKVVALP